MAGRVVSVALGAWLIATALAAASPAAQMYNGWICGVLVVVFAMAAWDGWGRSALALVGAWLILSPIVFLPGDLFTQLNLVLTGAAVATLALWVDRTDDEFIASWSGTAGYESEIENPT
jgi:hypothetical protein